MASGGYRAAPGDLVLLELPAVSQPLHEVLVEGDDRATWDYIVSMHPSLDGIRPGWASSMWQFLRTGALYQVRSAPLVRSGLSESTSWHRLKFIGFAALPEVSQPGVVYTESVAREAAGATRYLWPDAALQPLWAVAQQFGRDFDGRSVQMPSLPWHPPGVVRVAVSVSNKSAELPGGVFFPEFDPVRDKFLGIDGLEARQHHHDMVPDVLRLC